MRVRVLGTAAGGGLPQWNCACPGCEAARSGPGARTQDCLAISADGDNWYLVNAGPDLRSQLLATPELAPGPGRRQTPLRGALLTSAELDHTGGLLGLREATEFTVYATDCVLDALPLRGVLDPYGGVRWSGLGRAPLALAGGLVATAVALGRKKPRYAVGAPDADDWVVAYRFTDPSGRALVYAPCVAAWTPALSAAISGADCALLDGSFFSDDEMTEQTGGGPTSRSMGHLPIRDTLPYRAEHPDTRWWYTHLNNTNPAAHPDSPQRQAVLRAGAEIASDGMCIDL